MVDPDDDFQCKDADCEYIEIYNTRDCAINLTNWAINTGTTNKTFNFYLEDYLIIARDKNSFVGNFSVNESKVIELSMILNNNNDSVFLFDNNSKIVSNFTYNSSIQGKSWQYCNNSWIEAEPTPGLPNNCTALEQNNDENNSSQDNNNQDNNQDNSQEAQVSLELNWDEDEIINGKEFEIEIKAFNLKDEDYDVKVWIEFADNNTIISDRYDEENDEWKSGMYYIYNLFNGPGNKTKDIILRIKEDYKDFHGDAKINVRIRVNEGSYIDEADIEKNIKILEQENDEPNNEPKIEENSKSQTEENKPKTNSSLTTGNVIKLGFSETKTQDIKTQKNIIYESKNELIKKYSIFGFALLCAILSILLIFNKLN